MADGTSLTVCTICMETYTKPKSLPCLHTFCEACLVKWISSKIKPGSRKKSFDCPVCRTVTTGPTGSKTDPHEWASKFPSNHIIVTLLDQEKVANNSKLCDSCFENNKRVLASYWCVNCSEAYCKKCIEAHRSMKMARKHKILELSDVLKDLKQISSDDMCDIHEEEKIKLFCADHDTPCCSLCATIDHRKCNVVQELKEIAKDVKQSSRFQNLLKGLTELDGSIEQVESTITSHVHNLQSKKRNIQLQSNKLTESTIRHIKKMQKKFNQKLKRLHASVVVSMKAQEEACQLQRKIINDSNNLLQKTVSNATDAQIFLQMKRTEDRLRKCEKVKDELSSVTFQELSYKLERDAFVNVHKMKKLGSVLVLHFSTAEKTTTEKRETTTEMTGTTTEIPKTTAEIPKTTAEIPETTAENTETATVIMRSKWDDDEPATPNCQSDEKCPNKSGIDVNESNVIVITPDAKDDVKAKSKILERIYRVHKKVSTSQSRSRSKSKRRSTHSRSRSNSCSAMTRSYRRYTHSRSRSKSRSVRRKSSKRHSYSRSRSSSSRKRHKSRYSRSRSRSSRKRRYSYSRSRSGSYSRSSSRSSSSSRSYSRSRRYSRDYSRSRSRSRSYSRSRSRSYSRSRSRHRGEYRSWSSSYSRSPSRRRARSWSRCHSRSSDRRESKRHYRT